MRSCRCKIRGRSWCSCTMDGWNDSRNVLERAHRQKIDTWNVLVNHEMSSKTRESLSTKKYLQKLSKFELSKNNALLRLQNMTYHYISKALLKNLLINIWYINVTYSKFIETQVLMKYFLNAHTLSIISNNQNEYSQLINDNETNNIQLRNKKKKPFLINMKKNRTLKQWLVEFNHHFRA